MFSTTICLALALVSAHLAATQTVDLPIPEPPLGQISPLGPSAPSAPGNVNYGNYVPIVQQNFEQQPGGQYRWSYAGADGSSHDVVGGLGPVGLGVQGSYAYQSPQGAVQVNYVADEYGFQPVGAHIHPAVLEAVRRQVEFARSEPPGLYNDAGFPVNAPGPLGSPGPLLPGPTAPGPALF